jgi:hypothetical protein
LGRVNRAFCNGRGGFLSQKLTNDTLATHFKKPNKKPNKKPTMETCFFILVVLAIASSLLGRLKGSK